jgi:hypothetical protein
MTKRLPEPLSARIRRLEEERLYSRPGWRVPVRTVRIARSPWNWRLSLKEWLMYPLINARV